ncbi:MAG: DJ-1/PfpI family protein, partial [Gammaproteobacteria bacterium]|nr:DJ-1/PfpI family protein [Gammaproteobacteria bacterium]
MKKNAVIITGNLVQDHEFIYPYYRLLEENFKIVVCINEGKAVKGILGTDIPSNKEQTIKKIEEIKTDDFNLLIIPGGVKAMEKVRQNIKIIDFITKFHNENKIIGC